MTDKLVKADSKLDIGFPLKDSDTDKKISVHAWFQSGPVVSDKKPWESGGLELKRILWKMWQLFPAANIRVDFSDVVLDGEDACGVGLEQVRHRYLFDPDKIKTEEDLQNLTDRIKASFQIPVKEGKIAYTVEGEDK